MFLTPSHIEHTAHLPPSPFCLAVISFSTTIIIHWRHAHQRCNLLAVHFAQFWQLSQQGGGGHGSHTWRTAQDLTLFLPSLLLTKKLLDLLIQSFLLFLQAENDLFHRTLEALYGGPQAILLGFQHFFHLFAPHQQGTELLFRFTFALIPSGLHSLSKDRQDFGIQLVGLCQEPTGSGKLPDPRGVHHCHGQTCLEECFHYAPLVATRGFHHNEFRLQFLHRLHQFRNSCLGIVHLPPSLFPQHRHIQPVLRHVDPNITTSCHLVLLSV